MIKFRKYITVTNDAIRSNCSYTSNAELETPGCSSGGKETEQTRTCYLVTTRLNVDRAVTQRNSIDNKLKCLKVQIFYKNCYLNYVIKQKKRLCPPSRMFLA